LAYKQDSVGKPTRERFSWQPGQILVGNVQDSIIGISRFANFGHLYTHAEHSKARFSGEYNQDSLGKLAGALCGTYIRSN
jgi:hypothetical protein